MLRKICREFVAVFRRENLLEPKLFTVVGLVGVIASIIYGFIYLAIPKHLTTAVFCFFAAVLSLALIIYVQQSGKYLLAYYVTIFGVFIGLFTILFFLQGANSGYLFIMGLLFTCMLLHGKHLAIVLPIQFVWDILVFIYTFYHPELIHDISSPNKNLTSLLIGCVGVGSIICMSTGLYIRAYKKANVTAEIAAKEAREAGLAKDRFLANMSHEIRTPINTIMGMNEIISRETGSESIYLYTEDIKSSGEELLDIINNILDYSRIGAGKECIHDSVYRVKDIVHKWEYTGNNLAGKKNILFTANIDSKLPEVLYGDYEKINRIVLNLISNAVKYTDFGSVKLTVRVDVINGDEVTFRIQVKDTGHGIRKDDMDTLFNSFERLDPERNRKVSGTGLGLAISKELAELMNAELTCESEYEKGSQFTLVITQKVKEESDYIDIHNDALVLKKIIKAPDARVLVVDDNESNRNIISLLLKRSEIKMDMAESGVEALSRYKANRYDAVLMDYRMSEMDGIEVMNRIRMLDDDEGEGRHTPIIAVTADCIEGTKERLLKAGFDAFLQKPVSEASLTLALLKLLPSEMTSEVSVEKTFGNDEEAKEDYSSEKGATILLTDDDSSMHKIAGSILEEEGYCITGAVSGEECLEVLKKAAESGLGMPDLILLDVNMTGMSGYDTYREIRKIKDCEFIPIIFITSETSVETEVLCMELGAADFILKPFVKDIMLARISNHISRSLKLKKEMTALLENSNCNPEKVSEVEKKLSPTEFLIAKMMSEGYTNRDISEKTNYSYSYVKKVASIIFEKLEIEKRSDMRELFK